MSAPSGNGASRRIPSGADSPVYTPFSPSPSPPANTMAEIRMQQETRKRMAQLFDENDHKRCSDGNRKALLAEKLEQLRGLVKEFDLDDWKYAAPVSLAAASATKSILGDAKLELGSGNIDNEEDDEFFGNMGDAVGASARG